MKVNFFKSKCFMNWPVRESFAYTREQERLECLAEIVLSHLVKLCCIRVQGIGIPLVPDFKLTRILFHFDPSRFDQTRTEFYACLICDYIRLLICDFLLLLFYLVSFHSNLPMKRSDLCFGYYVLACFADCVVVFYSCSHLCLKFSHIFLAHIISLLHIAQANNRC